MGTGIFPKQKNSKIRLVFLFLPLFVFVSLTGYNCSNTPPGNQPPVAISEPDPVFQQSGSVEGASKKHIERNDREKQADRYRDSIKQVRILKSVFKDKDCDTILREYEEEINKSIVDKKTTEKLRKMISETPVMNCINNPQHRKYFDELDEKLEDGLGN